jgi:predicted N-formylglutamate amidohydrolase
VYRSFALVPLVPPGVVTVTSTTPVPAGTVAAMLVGLLTVNVAAFAPKLTALAPVKLDPVIVANVPFGPDPGLTPVTTGAGGTM